METIVLSNIVFEERILIFYSYKNRITELDLKGILNITILESDSIRTETELG